MTYVKRFIVQAPSLSRVTSFGVECMIGTCGTWHNSAILIVIGQCYKTYTSELNKLGRFTMPNMEALRERAQPALVEPQRGNPLKVRLG